MLYLQKRNESMSRKKANVKLVRLTDKGREQFILDNQEAFRYGALEEFGGMRDGMFRFRKVMNQ